MKVSTETEKGGSLLTILFYVVIGVIVLTP